MMTVINNHIYDDLAETWWDENEFLHLLKVMVNPWRVPYFMDVLETLYGRDLSQVHLLDIGCGGGVLTEEFASMGCQVTGIDISPRSIEIARLHATRSGLSIDYQVGLRNEFFPSIGNALRQSVVVMCWNISTTGDRSLQRPGVCSNRAAFSFSIRLIAHWKAKFSSSLGCRNSH